MADILDLLLVKAQVGLFVAEPTDFSRHYLKASHPQREDVVALLYRRAFSHKPVAYLFHLLGTDEPFLPLKDSFVGSDAPSNKKAVQQLPSIACPADCLWVYISMVCLVLQ